MSQNELGRATAMDAATIKGVVDRLVKRDVVFTSASTKDKRRLLVDLTDTGRDKYARARTESPRVDPQDTCLPSRLPKGVNSRSF